MLHFHPFSEEHFLPKRATFDFLGLGNNNERVGSKESQARMLRQNLANLNIEVTQEQTLTSLDDLRGGIELQQTAQQQEQREVSELVQIANRPNGLNNAPERTRFMSDVQQRLSVMLAMLVNDGDITGDSLKAENIQVTLQRLVGEKETLKIGNRNLYAHEQELLGLPAILTNHANAEVKSAWEIAKRSLQINVQLMRAAASAITETGNESFSLGQEADKILEAVKKQWNESSPTTKTVAKIAAIAGGLWILNRMFRGTTEGGRSSIYSILGIGALLAGGLYIGGKYMEFNRALEELKGLFGNLDPAKLSRGLRAYMDGNFEEARRYWGEHYDAIVGRFSRRGQGENHSPSVRESVDTQQNRDQVRYTATRDTLIRLYCLSDREYPEARRVEMRQVFNHLRGQQMANIIRLWEVNKNNQPNVISGQNGIINMPDGIRGENVFMAISIIGRTYELYQRRFNIDQNQPLTLDIFLQRVASDPIHEASFKIHEALIHMISEGAIRLDQLNLSSLEQYFEQQKQAHTDSMCEKLGVNIQNLTQPEKVDFYAIAFSLYRDTRLAQSPQEAVQSVLGGQVRSPKAIEAAREFFEKTKQRTLQSILPGIIGKFNISPSREPGNNNILRDNLTVDKLTFGQAFHLSVVSANFSFEASRTISEIEDLTLLFVALKCLQEPERNRYYSEMAYMLINAPTTFQIPLPSLARLKPYFGKLKEVATEILSNKRDAITELASAFVGDRSPEQQREFLRQVRESDYLEFGLMTGQEGVRGSYRVTKDILLTLAELKATYDDFQSPFDIADLISIVCHLKGGLIIGERNGQTTGMLYLAGKYFVIQPVGIVWDALLAGMTGQEGNTTIAGRMSASFKTYMVGAAPYTVIGAVGGFATGGWKGVALGAARGLAAPITYPTRAVQVGMSAVEIGTQWATRGSLSNLLRNAEMVAEYERQVRDVLQGGELLGKRGLSEAWKRSKGFVLGNWQEARLETFLKNFERSYNKFFNFTSLDEAGALVFKQGERTTFLLRVEQAALRLRNFTTALSTHPGYAAANTPEAMQALIREIGILEPTEVTKLLGKVSNAEGVSKIRAMVDGGADFLRNESILSQGRKAFSAVVQRIQGWRNGANVTDDLAKSASFMDNADDVARASTMFDEAGNTGRAASFMDNVDDTVRASSFMDNADDVARASTLLDDGADAANVTRRIAEIARTRPALGSALEAINSGGKLSLEHIGALREAAKGSDMAELLRSTGKIPEEKIGKLVEVLARESEMTKIADGFRGAGVGVAEGVEGLSRMAKFLRALPVVGAVFSAGFSIYESWQTFAMAREVQNNPELRSILYDKGAATATMGVASITLDVGLLAAPKAFTAFSGALGATGVGLILVAGIEAIKYMVTQALDARAETYKGYDAWTAEAMSRAQVEAGIKLPTRTFEQACNGIKDCRTTGRVLLHEELIALNAEAVDDPEDAIQGLIENAGMNQSMSRDLVRGLVALTSKGLEDPKDVIEKLVDDAGMDQRSANELVDNARNGSLTMEQVLRAAGLSLTSEPRMTDAQITRIHDEAKNILLHEWLVTGNDGRSVGQTYDSAANTIANTITFGWLGHGGTEYYIQHASLTRAKLVQSLVILDSPGKSEDYLRYRIKYLQSRTTDLNVESLQQARELLTKSKLAADIFANRQQTFVIGGQSIDLSTREYDPATVTPERVKTVFDAFENQQKEEMTALLGEGIFNRIKNLDPNYLQYAAGVLMAYVTSNGDRMGTDAEMTKLANIASHIGLYLQSKGIRFSPEPNEVAPEELQLIIRMFTNRELNQDQVYESLGPFKQTNRDTAAIYSLARYFGYEGTPNIAMLRNFFTEEKASRQGLYWDPNDNEWTVNEEYGVDNDVVQNQGETLTGAIIRTMRLKPNNVLGSRYNAAMDGLRAGIRDDEARLQTTVDEMIAALQRGVDLPRAQDITPDRGTNIEQSPTAAAVTELASDTAAGYRSLVSSPMEGLRMANDQAVIEFDRATGGRYSRTVNWVRGSIGSLFSSN